MKKMIPKELLHDLIVIGAINTVLNVALVAILVRHIFKMERVLRLTGYLSRVENWDRLRQEAKNKLEEANGIPTAY